MSHPPPHLKHKIWKIRFGDQLANEKLGKVLTLSWSFLCNKCFSSGFTGMASYGDAMQQLTGPAFFTCVFAEDTGGQSTGRDTDERYVRGKRMAQYSV